jgi:hypothetical protein
MMLVNDRTRTRMLGWIQSPCFLLSHPQDLSQMVQAPPLTISTEQIKLSLPCKGIGAIVVFC